MQFAVQRYQLSLLHYMNTELIYYACFYYSMNYGLIFCWNFSLSAKFFKMQKNKIRFITGCRSRDLFRNLFKSLKILHLQSHVYYHFSYMSLTTNIIFKLNSDVYHINTRKNITFPNLHQTYHYIKKESIQFALKYLTISHKVSKVEVMKLKI